jgi:hypothetical protein
MGDRSALHQVALEIVNEPGNVTLKGSALKFFQATFPLLAIRYTPCAMRFAEHKERGS